MRCCAVQRGNTLFDTMPIKPGMRQDVIGYQLKYSGTEFILRRTAVDSVGLLDIFLPDLDIEVRANNLEQLGRFDIQGQPYVRYAARHIQAGSVFVIRLSNLPPSQKDFRWLALSGVAIVVLLGVAAAVRRGRARAGRYTRVKSEEPVLKREERELLIQAIIALDEQFEAGELEEEKYLRRRNLLKQRLLDLDATGRADRFRSGAEQ